MLLSILIIIPNICLKILKLLSIFRNKTFKTFYVDYFQFREFSETHTQFNFFRAQKARTCIDNNEFELLELLNSGKFRDWPAGSTAFQILFILSSTISLERISNKHVFGGNWKFMLCWSWFNFGIYRSNSFQSISEKRKKTFFFYFFIDDSF